MWKREHLDPQERQEYDDIMIEAGLDESGNVRPEAGHHRRVDGDEVAT